MASGILHSEMGALGCLRADCMSTRHAVEFILGGQYLYVTEVAVYDFII